MDNYRPITLANALFKLWTTYIVMLATVYIEISILSPEQEGFRADRSCARAITHVGLCVRDAHRNKQVIIICYLDFKGAFPSADQDQLVRTLAFLGLPEDINHHYLRPLQWGHNGICYPPRTHIPHRGSPRHTIGRLPLTAPFRLHD